MRHEPPRGRRERPRRGAAERACRTKKRRWVRLRERRSGAARSRTRTRRATPLTPFCMFLSASVKYRSGPGRPARPVDSLASAAAVSSGSGVARRRTPSDATRRAPATRDARRATTNRSRSRRETTKTKRRLLFAHRLVLEGRRELAERYARASRSRRPGRASPRGRDQRLPARSNSAARPGASPAMFAVTSVAFRRQSGAGPNASESSRNQTGAAAEPPPVKFEFEFGFGFAASEDDRRLARRRILPRRRSPDPPGGRSRRALRSRAPRSPSARVSACARPASRQSRGWISPARTSARALRRPPPASGRPRPQCRRLAHQTVDAVQRVENNLRVVVAKKPGQRADETRGRGGPGPGDEDDARYARAATSALSSPPGRSESDRDP